MLLLVENKLASCGTRLCGLGISGGHRPNFAGAHFQSGVCGVDGSRGDVQHVISRGADHAVFIIADNVTVSATLDIGRNNSVQSPDRRQLRCQHIQPCLEVPERTAVAASVSHVAIHCVSRLCAAYNVPPLHCSVDCPLRIGCAILARG